MDKMKRILGHIPALLSSSVSIFIYIFLFFYLVVFAALAWLIPALHDLAPSSDAQLVLGNYTNVLSALGASIAAGSGAAIHSRIKKMHDNHRQLQGKIDDLHRKMDVLISSRK